MKTKFVLASLFILSVGLQASAAESSIGDDDAEAACSRILTTQLSRWKRQVRSNLTKLSSFPLYPVQVENSPALIAAALNIKPEEAQELSKHAIQLSLSGNRLQLELEKWPRFHRTQISLRNPEVIKDFATAGGLIENFNNEFFALSVQANTRLFYVIRDLPHETELGLVMPIREVVSQGPGHAPFFEFQLALIKPCMGLTPLDQTFTDENGSSICVDTLVNLSTWPDNVIEGFVEN